MFTWLKRHFIPNDSNLYRPHLLRAQNTRSLVAVVIFFELVLFVFPVLDFNGFLNSLNISSVMPGVLSALTNEERAKNDLPELIENPQLAQVAQEKANDMASKSYFAHTSPEGKTPWYWFDNVGYKYSYAGENLAVNFVDSKDVTEAWMNSPTHRANIVAYGYTEVGTGVAVGTYKGHEAIFVAQVYGRPPLYVDNSAAVTQATPGLKLQIPKSPSFWQKVMSSPRQTTNAMLYTVLSIVLLALFFNISIQFERRHADLVTNGLVLVAIILAIHLANGYISAAQFDTSFVAFESQNVAQSQAE